VGRNFIWPRIADIAKFLEDLGHEGGSHRPSRRRFASEKEARRLRVP
jgi:hypothetical protein